MNMPTKVWACHPAARHGNVPDVRVIETVLHSHSSGICVQVAGYFTNLLHPAAGLAARARDSGNRPDHREMTPTIHADVQPRITLVAADVP